MRMPEYFTAMRKCCAAPAQKKRGGPLGYPERTEAKQCLLNIRAGRAEPATTDAYGDIQAGERAIYCMSENRASDAWLLGIQKAEVRLELPLICFYSLSITLRERSIKFALMLFCVFQLRESQAEPLTSSPAYRS